MEDTGDTKTASTRATDAQQVASDLADAFGAEAEGAVMYFAAP